jgi:hypothetical protein
MIDMVTQVTRELRLPAGGDPAMLNHMVRKATLLAVLSLLLAGCAAQSLEERAHDRLQDRVYAVHEGFLDRRARDPDSTGQALRESLDPYGDSVDSSVDDDGISLVRAIGASVSEMEGWIEPHENVASVGGCVLVVIRYSGGEGDRGIVRTEPVDCPPGTEILGDDGYPVAALTTDLEGRMDDVPEPPYDPPVCLSGGDCSRGGG